jgi:flagellar basal body-associated protein FliL
MRNKERRRRLMKKPDIITIVKIAGVVLTIGGTIASAWSGSKETERTLEKLVAERLASKDQ